MSILEDLARWVEKKPLVLMRFDKEFAESLQNSNHGFERFTFAKPHNAFEGINLPTLCLVETDEGNRLECYVGVIKAKVAVTTIDSRVTIIKLRGINISSFESFSDQMSKTRFKNTFKSKLSTAQTISILTSKLSSYIIEMLAADNANKNALEVAAFYLPRFRTIPNAEWGQTNAIQTAMAVFGLSKTAIPKIAVVRKNTSSTLSNIGAHLLEDNVIGCDSSVIPGFSLIKKDVTGKAVFENREGRLEVYTANRGSLEEMLGVDLIYVNNTLGNIVMIQYKMLEESKSEEDEDHDWIFRPDGQMESEIARMKIPSVAVEADDYRLNENPFYFKFVKRKIMNDSHQSFLISLQHLNQLLQSHRAKGPRGGIRVSYRALEGTYLRETDIISLIRSGYIGTHRVESEFLKTIISEVSKGNRALVLAWQSKIKQEDNES
ncbi:MAG: hypothetical protein JRC90_02165 [Deltaproteobacteria bacterium]|nr:hypothetical protein [Deltaproteobacteria bacterium]